VNLPVAHHGLRRRGVAGAPGGGFSLLEVLVAVTIFSIVMTTIYSTFRTAMRAYEMGLESGQILQVGRFTVDALARDIKGMFYRAETQYNITYRQKLTAIEQELEVSEGRVVDQEALNEMIDKFNMTQSGIDLAIRGSESEISFVRRQIQTGARAPQPMRLARVKYYLDENKLMREEHDVFLMPLDYGGEQIVTADGRPEVVAEDVEEFSIYYGFYYDGEWLEANDWDSSAHDKRVDSIEILPTDPLLETLQTNIQQVIDRMPEDGPPSYVRLELTVRDEDKGVTSRFQRTINIVNSYDSHVPLPDEFSVNDAEGQSHQYFRSQFYTQPKGKKRASQHKFGGAEERRRLGGRNG